MKRNPRNSRQRRLGLESLEGRRLLSAVPTGFPNACGLLDYLDQIPPSESSLETGAATAELVSVTDADAARDTLLAGVSQIAVVGAPGQIAVFDPPAAGPGQGAFSVMQDGDYRPMVAAAIWGNGKIVAFGHNGYVNFGDNGDTLDTGQLYLNSIQWTSGSAGTGSTIVTNQSSTRNWLQARGYTNVSVHSNWENFLTGADVLIVELGRNVSSAKQTAVSNFVQNGGGLITGGTGWGYKQLGADLVTLDGNQVLRDAGLGWSDGFRNGTTAATNRSTELSNASLALDFAERFWARGYGTTAQQEEAGEALQTVLGVLPADHPLAIEIANAFSARAASISATPSSPVSDPLDQAVLTWESNHLLATPVNQVTAHHTAEAVYGTIPANAPRIVETVAIDTSISRWHATGLYAAPGEIVTIAVPPAHAGQGYQVRINAHQDDISQRGSWERMPVVHRSFSIDASVTQVASAFGGLIFIDVGSTPPNQGTFDVTIQNAIEAPYFVLGQHPDQDWNDTLRDNPAPYGVLVSAHLMIVLPKHQIESANLTEPTALMTWWNQVASDQDDLASRLSERTSPEIINVDVQQSAGAAHSGYPIQAYEKHWGNLADLDRLQTRGSWGDFHELGHNHQRGWWTFNGDGEVTVNVFSNFNLEHSASDPSGGWAWTVDPVQVMQEAIRNVASGGSYSSKSNRWSFWHQLSDGFGWDTYRNVFESYELDDANNKSNLPSSNQQEKDQWFTRWSTEVGYDMKRFMVDTWGLSVSQSAINSVSGLPDWMPLATTVADFQVDSGGSQQLNLANGGMGMDGVATFVAVTTPPQNGSLRDNGNGTYTYEPDHSAGTDSLVVRYRSSAGNTQDFTIEIMIGNGNVPGDVNLDGVLDEADIAQFIEGWRSDTTGLSESDKILRGDLNLSNRTDLADAFILHQAWQAKTAVTLELASLIAAGQGDGDAGNADVNESVPDVRTPRAPLSGQSPTAGPDGSIAVTITGGPILRVLPKSAHLSPPKSVPLPPRSPEFPSLGELSEVYIFLWFPALQKV